MPFDNVNVPESELTHALREARDLIDKGWISGTLSNGKGGFCALGAAYHVAYPVSRISRIMIRLLAKHADYVPFNVAYVARETYDNRFFTTMDPGCAIIVAAHNDILGREATLRMFDAAIAESIAMTMDAATV
jgi:hypothetical protein